MTVAVWIIVFLCYNEFKYRLTLI